MISIEQGKLCKVSLRHMHELLLQSPMHTLHINFMVLHNTRKETKFQDKNENESSERLMIFVHKDFNKHNVIFTLQQFIYNHVEHFSKIYYNYNDTYLSQT